MKMLPRFLQYPGFETIDFKEFLSKGFVEVVLRREDDATSFCNRCNAALEQARTGYHQRIEEMPVMGYRSFVSFPRRKGYCPKCKKVRSEVIDFISDHTPHKTKQLCWWIGRMCEIASISRVAELNNQDGMTTWRLDFSRMKHMAQYYKVPRAKRLCVDEVYARKKKEPGENRSDLFFTVISDLDTRRVVWVSQGRSKEALDQYFLIIGEKACKQVQVIATDQFDGYKASIEQHCPNATHVWDKFHIMKIFEEKVNEERKTLHDQAERGSELKKLSRGKYRFLFLKKASRRTEEEKAHLDQVIQSNERFMRLELIKERMLSFFNSKSVEEAKDIFDEVGSWIVLTGFNVLWKWHNEVERGWKTLINYFKHRVTNALAEGINNVIKMLKRRAFGYRNMDYFRLKIMQVCGYLNSRFIPDPNYAQTPTDSSS